MDFKELFRRTLMGDLEAQRRLIYFYHIIPQLNGILNFPPALRPPKNWPDPPPEFANFSHIVDSIISYGDPSPQPNKNIRKGDPSPQPSRNFKEAKLKAAVDAQKAIAKAASHIDAEIARLQKELK